MSSVVFQTIDTNKDISNYVGQGLESILHIIADFILWLTVVRNIKNMYRHLRIYIYGICMEYNGTYGRCMEIKGAIYIYTDVYEIFM